MNARFHILFFYSIMTFAELGLMGCANGKDAREMIPIGHVLAYSEKVDLRTRQLNPIRRPGFSDSFAKDCLSYHKQIETVRTVNAVAASVGLASVVVGILAEDKTIKTIAVWAGAGATLTEVGAGIAGNIISHNAEEKRLWGAPLRSHVISGVPMNCFSNRKKLR